MLCSSLFIINDYFVVFLFGKCEFSLHFCFVKETFLFYFNMSKKRKIYNSDILEALESKHGVTISFIRLAIKGERKSEKATQIKDEYYSHLDQLKSILENKNQA